MIGGLRLTNSVTNANFYSMMGIPFLFRTISDATGTRTQAFCDAVRSRDRRCLISGREALGADYNDWSGFKAAHIFPLITIPPADPTKGSINSVKSVNQRLLNDSQRPADQLLRWQFWQAGLAIMRGDWEPILEHYFPPGSDIVGDIFHGPKAAETMEYKYFSRLVA
ncbi:hypothetical protein K469DRAFT_769894 [Zopfia rhizophila CBS 207.26]|uniref:DUF7881 domain-containing protein n=1 Tax=Zopfia rhizophila CBS 207.26 TaxID=1314779 RepID=A0A6A6EBM7_9PEZI|nr:hypothetical protein K469DRAFT_769894 [Zopfia rhizophila CBS 207.26]